MTTNKDGFVGGSLITHEQLTALKLAKRVKSITDDKPKKKKKPAKKAD